MNKSDKLIAALLALLLIGWLFKTHQEAKAYAKYLEEHPEARAEAVQPETPVDAEPAAPAELSAPPAAVESPVAAAEAPAEPAPAPALPEQTLTVTNSVAAFTFSSKGGTVRRAELLGFDRTLDEADGKVAFDFADADPADPYADAAALSLEGIPGLDASADFSIENRESEGCVVLTAPVSDGLSFVRTVCYTNGYNLAVRDSFRNTGDAASSVPAFRIVLGRMESVLEKDDGLLGFDLRTSFGKSETLEQSATESVGKGQPKFGDAFGASGGGCSAALVEPSAPLSAVCPYPFARKVDWLAVRERFFVEVLTPAQPGVGAETRLTRRPVAGRQALRMRGVAAALSYDACPLAPGASCEYGYSLYIGPRKMSELRRLSKAHVDIMRFGTWSLFCRALLDILNGIHAVIPNYGWAIIVLTILVRLVLFPLNRKSTLSMRRMQEIQPLLKELQTKYKDDPRKLQQEQMRLYSEHKVNPLASCLPMLIQLPIFIALFTVLRSCIEMRYAPFLWIADLSEPEGLFRSWFPFGGLNILPIAMAATMTLQSRLTPTTGDAKQQQMMMIMMPVMMLLMCYRFPSALGLYWAVSQALAIFGLWRIQKTSGKKDGGAFTQADGSVVTPPPRVTRQMRRHG